MEPQKQKYSKFKGQPRLPKFAFPKHYDLKLKPDLKAWFTGAVDISVDIVSVTTLLVLDIVELSVCPNFVKFTYNNKVVEAVDVEMCEKNEIMVLEFEENLQLGVEF